MPLKTINDILQWKLIITNGQYLQGTGKTFLL